MLPVQDRNLLRRYYEKGFEGLQQINCRILAKAYIKLVEPRKQVNYPYNGRKIISGISQQFDPEMTKPTWWPSGVTHREPDHLLKSERIRLLVHILCELRDSHAICVEKLKEADQSIRRQIMPSERLQVLDEIYRVREEEERYLSGRTDGQAVVYVSLVHLPDVGNAQNVGSPTNTMIKSDINPVYRRAVPDMESHTSVFPTTGSAPTIETIDNSKDTSTLNTSLPTMWNNCVSSSLPPLNSQKRTHEGETPYPLDMPNAAMFQDENSHPVSLDTQSLPLRYYSEPHFSQPQNQQHQPLPIVGVPGTDVGNCTQPYYFNY
ncbi:DUF2841 domain-containing protein [Aspergillus tanneri]|nr:uncharacterized protein ATNIH1004_002357 [Aspergillus tanneri]KAA8649685.1 hypothetical protein ATNIH1004_002357 [Aspergillus tanneri]